LVILKLLLAFFFTSFLFYYHSSSTVYEINRNAGFTYYHAEQRES